MTTEIRSLPVELTEDELRALGRKLAGLRNDIATAKFAAKQAAKSAKTVIDGLELDAAETGRCITTGVEHREIECEWRSDYATNVMRFIRTDTFETLTERAMTAEERQTELFDGSKPSPRSRKRGRLESVPTKEAE